MRILDKYITRSLITIFITTVLIFCFLYILIELTSTLDEIIDRKIPLRILVQYYSCFFPVILVQTSSVCCLIATLLTFSSLSKHNEITAMRSSGLNFWRITRPAIFFGLIISVLVFYINEKYVPKSTEITQKIRNENMILKVDRMRKKRESIKNLTFYGLKNRLYFIDSFDPHENKLKGITIVEYDDSQNIKQKIVAFSGTWASIAWKFHQCQITIFNPIDITTPLKVKVYEEKLMDIKETPEDFLKQRLNVDSMNIKQLSKYIERFSKSGATRAIDKLKVDLHEKIAYPFGNFVIILVGLPFALLVRNRKGSTFTSLAIALAVGFFYYVANAVMLAFGKGGLLPPILSAWAAPIIFTVLALIVIESDFAN